MYHVFHFLERFCGHPVGSGSVCFHRGAYHPDRVSPPRPTPETPEADHRIVSPSVCAQRRRAGENILPKWAMREIRAWISLVSSETVHPDRYKCPSRWEGARERLLSVRSFMTLHILHILVPPPSALKQLGHRARWPSHNGKLVDVNR